jgi:hypothetical protein
VNRRRSAGEDSCSGLLADPAQREGFYRLALRCHTKKRSGGGQQIVTAAQPLGLRPEEEYKRATTQWVKRNRSESAMIRNGNVPRSVRWRNGLTHCEQYSPSKVICKIFEDREGDDRDFLDAWT